MTNARAALRRFWLNVHLWLGISLAILTVPIAVSGALLVFHDDLDEILNPVRYAVTDAATQPASAYFDAARGALGPGLAPSVVRFPADDGGPVVVSARGRTADGRMQVFNVYLDPPTGRVLDVVDFRASLFGFLHVFHENLTIPQYSGRAIVGWVGVAMLISSLSGIYLWWPRGRFRRGLRWQRTDSTNANLHYLLGFWISLPLAVVSATGIYLGFPQQGRELLSSLAPVSPRPAFGAPARQTALTADAALAKALEGETGAVPVALFAATAPQGTAPTWRVQYRSADAELRTVLVNDRSGAVERVTPLKGDRIAQWIRWIHEGSHSGPVWKAVVFLCGVFPPIFAFTGVVMWWRRSSVKRMRRQAAAKLRPAE